MAQYAREFSHPDFSDWRYYAQEMIVTLQIALWGTFLAAAFAVPLGVLSARNMAPWYIVQPVRRVMDACRSTHELVFAVLFVVVVGLGTAGVDRGVYVAGVDVVGAGGVGPWGELDARAFEREVIRVAVLAFVAARLARGKVGQLAGQ